MEMSEYGENPKEKIIKKIYQSEIQKLNKLNKQNENPKTKSNLPLLLSREKE